VWYATRSTGLLVGADAPAAFAAALSSLRFARAGWPIAVVHGFGTGTDAARGWMLALTALCVAAVAAAAAWRLAVGWPDRAGIRVAAGAAALVTVFATVAWLRAGPLSHDWARRAGTPASLLAGDHPGAGSHLVLAVSLYRTGGGISGTLTVSLAGSGSD
jgi:hypothetical protein